MKKKDDLHDLNEFIHKKLLIITKLQKKLEQEEKQLLKVFIERKQKVMKQSLNKGSKEP